MPSGGSTQVRLSFIMEFKSALNWSGASWLSVRSTSPVKHPQTRSAASAASENPARKDRSFMFDLCPTLGTSASLGPTCSVLMRLRGTQQCSHSFLPHLAPHPFAFARLVVRSQMSAAALLNLSNANISRASIRSFDSRWGSIRGLGTGHAYGMRHETDTCHCEQGREATRLRCCRKSVSPPQVQSRRSARLTGPLQPPVCPARCRRAIHTNVDHGHANPLSSKRITPASLRQETQPAARWCPHSRRAAASNS
jgi:hypothetical protein